MFRPLEFVKEHPVETGAVVFVAGFALVLLLSQGGGAAQTAGVTNPANDPSVINAEIQAASQQQQIAAQSAAQQANINGQISLATIQGNNQVAIARLQANTTNTANYDQLQMTLAQTAAQLTLGTQTIQAQQAVQLAGLATQENIVAITNNAAVQENAQNNSTLQVIAGYQAQTTIAQTNLLNSISKRNASSSMFGSIAGLAGTAAILAFA